MPACAGGSTASVSVVTGADMPAIFNICCVSTAHRLPLSSLVRSKTKEPKHFNSRNKMSRWLSDVLTKPVSA
jgi:hypothetical protein